MWAMRKGVEGIVWDEAKRFVSKDPTKRKLVAGLYAMSLRGWETGKITRASYFFLRQLDDVLDGEMSNANPLKYAQDRRQQVETGEFIGTSAIDNLAKFALPRLEQRAKPGDNPRGEFLTVIDAMMFDHNRRLGRQTTTADTLLAHHKRSNDPPFNILLTGIESNLRMRDIPDYGTSMGRIYSVRDLDKDWQLGLINIPDEVLTTAEVAPSDSLDMVRRNPLVDEWLHEEVTDSSAVLQAVRKEVLPDTEPLARLIIGGMARQAMQSVA